MWVKKTVEELKNKGKKKNIKRIFITQIFMFLGTIFTFIVSFKIGGGFAGHRFKDWGEIYYLMPDIIWMSVAVLVFMWLLQIFAGLKLDSGGISTVICDKCNIKKPYDKINSCSCGGEFIYIKKMKWVDKDS